MDIWESLRLKIEERAKLLEIDARQYKQEMLAELDQVKNNQIASTLEKVLTRLDAIEARLPEEEE